MIIALVAVALASSGFTYAVLNTQQNNMALSQDLEVEELESQIADLNSSLALMSQRLDDLNLALSTSETQFEDLTQDTENAMANITEIKENITSLQTALNTIQNEVLSLVADMQNMQTQVASILLDIVNIQTQITSLQSKIAEIESCIDTLSSTDKIVVRVSFLEFTILDTLYIPPPLPADYLFDVGIYVLRNGIRQIPSVSSARSGHSRFIRPTYVELTIRNGSEYNGEPLFIHLGDEVHVYIVAYYHLDDAVIDVQPSRSLGPQPIGEPWKESGSSLFIPYLIGSVESGSVNGEDDGWLTDHRDAYLRYKIETFCE